MSILLRRRALALAVLTLMSAAPAAAQAPVQTAAQVALDVVRGLLIVPERDLDFGVVGRGAGTVTVGATSPAAGYFRLVSDASRFILLTLTPPSNLQNGASTIPYTWAASYNASAPNPSTSSALAALALIQPAEPVAGGFTQAHVWIHGSIDVGAGVAYGGYTGTFTLSAWYF